MAKGKTKTATYNTRVVEHDYKWETDPRFAPPSDPGWFVTVEVLRPMISTYRILGKIGQHVNVRSEIADELVTKGFAKRV
jgi:hypothetical protein